MIKLFRKFALKASNFLGTPQAFMLGLSSIIIWAALGPVFRWSEKHSLAVNTGTTISTFLMLFLLQYAQNRGTRAIQLKLDAILESLTTARSDVAIGIEDMEDELVKGVQQEIRDNIKE